MKMQQWLNARSAQLLTEINNTPLTDDSDELKMKMIMTAMRESSVEMFHRAAENSRKEIEKINNQAMIEKIQQVEDNLGNSNDSSEAKIKLTSSVIRRVDSF